MTFTVRITGGGPDSRFFIITRPPPGEDHYVQGEISGGLFSGPIHLGENGEYFESPETVTVYEVTDPDTAATIESSIAGPRERLPIPDWGTVASDLNPLGSITVIRREQSPGCDD